MSKPESELCYPCDGYGKLDGERCERCGGTGLVTATPLEGIESPADPDADQAARMFDAAEAAQDEPDPAVLDGITF